MQEHLGAKQRIQETGHFTCVKWTRQSISGCQGHYKRWVNQTHEYKTSAVGISWPGGCRHAHLENINESLCLQVWLLSSLRNCGCPGCHCCHSGRKDLSWLMILDTLAPDWLTPFLRAWAGVEYPGGWRVQRLKLLTSLWPGNREGNRKWMEPDPAPQIYSQPLS